MFAFATSLMLIGTVDWLEILRDAQSTNRANLRHGEASISLIYSPPKSLNDRDVTLEADIQWFEDNLFEKYRFQSFANFPFARKSVTPLEDSEWSYYLRNSSVEIHYNPRAKVLGIGRVGEPMGSLSILEFHPWSNWFNCCPPNARDGRSWASMLDIKVTEEDGRRSSSEFSSTDNDLIKHLRRDPDGTTVEVVYSLKQGGNVVRIETTPAPPGKDVYRGNYRWRALGKMFVLDSCHFERTPLSSKRKGEVEIYDLKVRSVKIHEIDLDVFSQTHLMNLLPSGDLQVMDRVNKRFGRMAGRPVMDDDQLRTLSATLRTRGFAKPN